MDQYIEKIASDKLGLVKNNAKIYLFSICPYSLESEHARKIMVEVGAFLRRFPAAS